MATITNVCDDVFCSSPHIHNELINRQVLSSAGAGARLRICERLFEFSDQAFLGMDATKHPPEMSMYLSVLLEAGLHHPVSGGNKWAVALPDEAYDQGHCRILPVMHRLEEFLLANSGYRVQADQVFEELNKAPYGVRNGLVPLFVAVFAIIHEQELAFYEDGSFIPRMSGSVFLRLIKAAETFQIQFYPVTGVRTELFQTIVRELQLNNVQPDNPELLDVVRPLMVFMAELPEYVTKTTSLSRQTLDVRQKLLSTKDPIQLLFHDLPAACGIRDINPNGSHDEEIQEFVARLRGSIDELRGSYPMLIESIWKVISQEFKLQNKFDNDRRIISERAQVLATQITEPRLRSFCLTLADTNLSEYKWLEAIGNLVCSMPPSRWRDSDNYRFEQEVHRLARQFHRVEALVFSKNQSASKGESFRVALTQRNGEERDQVIHLEPEQRSIVDRLEAGVEASIRAVWSVGPSRGIKSSMADDEFRVFAKHQ